MTLDRSSPVIALPEPHLSREMLLARADALIPTLRDEQEASDQRGYYSDAIHQSFMDAGFYRTLQPRMFGGYEFDFETFLDLVSRISRGHPSSGWCFTLAASHCLALASHWNEQAQRDLFGRDGDFRSCHRAPPAGEWKKVDGGYVVSGTWSYSSGVPVSNHFGGGAILPDKNGKPSTVNFFVARDKVRILPDWGGDASLGMQGSGSNSVKLENVFVPEHHIQWGNILLELLDQENGTPGYRLHGNPMYLGVVGGPYHLTFSAIFAGAARASLDEYEEVIRTRNPVGNPNRKLYQQTDTQYAYGEALMLVDSAEALMRGAAQLYAEICERWVEKRTLITSRDTMRIWAMGRQSCMMSTKAVELLFHTGGPRIANRGQRLQRYMRDIQMYRIHPSSQQWVLAARAQTQLGLPVEYFAARP